ncbi:MAG TPA: RNA polymerase sigma-70 factor [Ignavibacteriaceae bacterium]|nr:RNA polymerase sigma-70 factor [Ignavibacteriaceae bacterium]
MSSYNRNNSGQEFSEIEIIGKIQSGDVKIFEALFREYYYSLSRFTTSIVKSSSAAEDLVQDIFLKIWENRQTWNPQGTIKTYLYRASKNQALNYLKHLNVVHNWAEFSRNSFSSSSSSINPEDEFERKELLNSVNGAVNKLPEKCKMIFLLHRHEGLSYREISEVLNISISTVETQMGRALKKIREILFPYLSMLLITIISGTIL